MTHYIQEEHDTMGGHKERRAKTLGSRAQPKTSSTSTEGSTTPRKAEGEAPPYTMPRDHNNQTYYPLQVNLDLKKGSTHKLQIQEM